MRIAIQMDPIEGISPKGDSSYLLGLGAQERGHELFYYTPQDLFWTNGKLHAHLSPLVLSRDVQNYFSKSPAQRVALAGAVDVILLRQDPPVQMGYLTTTYLLDHLPEKIKVLNNPTGVRNAPEKLLTLGFSQFMPDSLISGNAHDIREFAKQHGTVIVKKIYGNGGRDVFRFTHDDPQLYELAASHWQHTHEPLMLQEYIKDVEKGDKRIVLFDGAIVGAITRIPKAGGFLANLAQGGTATPTTLTPKEKEICDALAPFLKTEGLYFAGVDVIGDHLIEVNVTSPTGLASINALYALEDDARLEHRFWQGLGL